jgi:hypothetical protein
MEDVDPEGTGGQMRREAHLEDLREMQWLAGPLEESA